MYDQTKIVGQSKTQQLHRNIPKPQCKKKSKHQQNARKNLRIRKPNLYIMLRLDLIDSIISNATKLHLRKLPL